MSAVRWESGKADDEARRGDKSDAIAAPGHGRARMGTRLPARHRVAADVKAVIVRALSAAARLA